MTVDDLIAETVSRMRHFASRMSTSVPVADLLDDGADTISGLRERLTEAERQSRHLQRKVDLLLDKVHVANRRAEAAETALADVLDLCDKHGSHSLGLIPAIRRALGAAVPARTAEPTEPICRLCEQPESAEVHEPVYGRMPAEYYGKCPGEFVPVGTAEPAPTEARDLMAELRRSVDEAKADRLARSAAPIEETSTNDD